MPKTRRPSKNSKEAVSRPQAPSIKTDRFIPWMWASDVHGDKMDEAAIKILFDAIDVLKPEMRIFGGDLWDFRPLRKNAHPDERRESMKLDFRMGSEFFQKYAPHVYLRGNHCERLWDLSKYGAGVEADLGRTLCEEFEEIVHLMRCDMRRYDKTEGCFKMGRLLMMHGFHAGDNAVRQCVNVYGGWDVLMGHIHAVDRVSISGIPSRNGYSSGCLCQLDFEYNRTHTKTLRQTHGFVHGILDRRTERNIVYQVEPLEKGGSEWILSTPQKFYGDEKTKKRPTCLGR